MVLEAIKYRRGSLEILDQLKLPHQEIYLGIESPEDAWHAIKSMQVRGAPAIAIVAALSLAVVGAKFIDSTTESIVLHPEKPIPQFFSDKLKYLVTSRPTAVNLSEAATRLDGLVWTASKRSCSDKEVIETYIEAAEQMLRNDVNDNKNIGKFGAEWILQNTRPKASTQKVSVVTHCNTGSLATAGYGTALGVIRSLHAQGDLDRVFYTETRPYNQGSRLTGYELIHDNIPSTLVTDSMVAALLKLHGRRRNIVAVIVGADRVAANGDTANKIGTYQLAICARWHGIKFIVAAPLKTIDLNTKSGEDIVIEERPPSEMTSIKGPAIGTPIDGRKSVITDRTETISTAADHTDAWNPSFDVTPAMLIDAIVTEAGCVKKIDDYYDMSSVFDKTG